MKQGASSSKKGTQGKKTKKSSIKQQIRGVERLLLRELPPDVKKQHEQRLAALKQGMQDNAVKEKEQKLSKKYHMVKFFERQKLSRMIAQEEKKLEQASSSADKKGIAVRLEQLRLDLDYVVNFPRDRKFVSVLKTEDKDKVAELRALIRQRKAQAAEKARAEREREALGSEGEEEGAPSTAALQAEDDFFEEAEEEDEEEEVQRKRPASKRGAGEREEEEEEEEEEERAPKKKRDKKLPDRNRKAKRNKPPP